MEAPRLHGDPLKGGEESVSPKGLGEKMYSIQEMIEKSETQIKSIKHALDSGSYHPEEASIFDGQKASVVRTLQESLRNIPLSEFLGKSGTAGIAGAAYMVPEKVHDLLIMSAKRTDLCELIGYVVPSWQGGDLVVPIVKDEALRPRKGSGGGGTATGTKLSSEKATLSPVKFDMALEVDNEMIEDSNYGLIEWLIRNAGRGMGYLASEMALGVLIAAPDGDGTLNASATGDADETLMTGGATADIEDALTGIGDDEFIANTLITTPESWSHSIASDAGAAGYIITEGADGFHARLCELDVFKHTSPQLHDPTDPVGDPMTACINVIFDRYNAILTGRKRWLTIENYSDPIKDLAGAVVSSRQDSVTLYKDAIYVLTET